MDVRWAMVTTAELSLHGNEALLRQNGKSCKVTILEPEGALFEEVSTRPADPRPEETLNEGTTMLAAHIYQEETVPFTIKVAITPYDTTFSGGETPIWDSEYREEPGLMGIFPNPASDVTHVSFDLPKAERITLELFSPNGQLASLAVNGIRPAGRNVVPVPMGSLAPGVYVLKLSLERGSETGVVIRK